MSDIKKDKRQKQIDKDSKKRDLNKYTNILVTVIAVGLALYHLYTSRFGTPVALKHRAIHVGVVLILIFILYPFNKSKKLYVKIIDIVLVGLSFYSIYYISSNYMELVWRAGMPTDTDIVVATITLLLVIEGARRVMGNVLPSIAVVFLIYSMYGNLLTGRLAHRGFAFREIMEYMYLTTEGIYGIAVGVSAQYLILFIIFGAFLLKSGVGDFFNDLAIAIAGKSKGGPAQVAVISSGLMGSINGAAVANVVTTGAFTIPLMKRIGYSSEFAGGVEAAASCGGQFLPPVMGAAAFIMAETLGIKYINIVYAAIIPALLYYIAAVTMVYFRASKKNLRGMDADEVPNLKKLLVEKSYLFIPLIILVYFLVNGYTPTYSAFFAIVSTIVVSWFKKETRMTPMKIMEALKIGVLNALGVAIATAVVGIIVGVSTRTGFGSKLAGAIISWSGGNLLLTLFFTMIACIILGLGMPSIPAYILTATMAAPALGELGIQPMVAHFFVFYFAMMANVTPPVALAAFAAAGISGGDINKTGYQAFKMASAGFLIPYMFVLSPALLGLNSTPMGIITVTLTALVGVIALASANEGWFLRKSNILQRIFMLGSALLLIKPGGPTDLLGFAIFAGVIAFQKFFPYNKIEEVTG
ncbi:MULTISPECIES: TRAP transporter permease [unclassified Halanaerobium]|uniref:TRAP transporter permease n=1 Tax=unclassified Halanaerobium TaxID=2641197 RepID=UPI000DF371CE|nr:MULTISPECIES: TRAP transporter permease [unclassified Halanaerobium]RCW48682.1 TRAP transporter 4TM/12TM fusion protein [Halanaerobium sp. MA284_MarDTE_T2]RCW86574.1 TRAP transporter 4TM/12TM fusion protein [Halanaerobium sp. DL-01]